MKHTRINGLLMDRMLRSGLGALTAAEEELNNLNVFPVADGDTGTNMMLTLRHGIAASSGDIREVGPYMKRVSDGMLLGARGNSGVILSQLIKGFYTVMARDAECNVIRLRDALIGAYKTAYASVIRPVEGTILTVAREGIEHIKGQIDRNTCIEDALSMYIAEMRRSLAATPDMLGVLKEAGVVDSGAAGYITMLEGMLGYLYGEKQAVSIKRKEPVAAENPGKAPDAAFFDENSSFSDGYCMEFMLQRLNDPAYTQRFRISSFTDDLNACGESLIVIEDGKRVKVHIHTKKPGKVISVCQEYGEFISFKLENMQLQHNEHVQKTVQAPHIPLAVIAVADGEGNKATLGAFDYVKIIDGGRLSNPSAEAFTAAIRGVNADRIVILPNNRNSVPAAEQALCICGVKNGTVIPTDSIADGYYALAMDIPDSSDASYRESQLREGAAALKVMSVAAVSAGRVSSGIECLPGGYCAVAGGDVIYSCPDRLRTVCEGLKRLSLQQPPEAFIVFCGRNTAESDRAALESVLTEDYPSSEVTVFDGGQELYDWIIGIV